MLFAKDHSPFKIAALAPRWVSHCATEKTQPAFAGKRGVYF
jgi:hypothetical protein